MQSPKTNRHLQYESIFAWIEGEKIPTPVTEIHDEKLRSELFDQLGELRQYLFNKHLKTLSQIERDQLNAGTHASQNHEGAKIAKEFAKALHSELLQHGLDVNVTPGLYHMNRVIINVLADRNTPRENLAKFVPQFYRGFEVQIGFVE